MAPSISIKLIKILLEYDLSKIDSENREFFQKQFSQKDLLIPYDAIADYVYQNENSIESNEKLNNNITILCLNFNGSKSEKSNLDTNLNQISSNYSLYQAHKSYISKIAQGVKREVEDVKKEIEKANSSVVKLNELVAEIDKTKSSIYTDFIAILGVFSAFVVVLFGGIEVIRSVFDVGEDLMEINLGQMISISCLVLIAVITLLYSLLLWIARITNKDIGNCMCSECKNGCLHKWKHFYLRHSFYFSLVILLVIITIVAIKCS